MKLVSPTEPCFKPGKTFWFIGHGEFLKCAMLTESGSDGWRLFLLTKMINIDYIELSRNSVVGLHVLPVLYIKVQRCYANGRVDSFCRHLVESLENAVDSLQCRKRTNLS